MKTIKHLLPFALLLCLFTACKDEETYADKRERETNQVKSFLANGCNVSDADGSTTLLHVVAPITTISEQEFYAQDSTTSVERNEYVLFKNTGVYMQIVEKGQGERIKHGDNVVLLMRYYEFNIATDSLQSTNYSNTYAIEPDVMAVSNSYGTFSASYVSGLMKKLYNSSTVPSAWLTPLTYIRPGRDDAHLAKVRLIVPSSQGQSDAAANVYPCFYEITYQRSR